MYKCYDCGYEFDEPAYLDEGFGRLAVCPNCHGEYDEAVRCPECGEYFCEDLLPYGICEPCLKDSLSLENLRKYLKDTDQEADFYVEFILDSKFLSVSDDLLKVCKDDFDASIELEGDELMELAWDFVKANIGDYADWYKEEKQ